MKIDGERLPEVQQFADLVRDLNRHVAPEGSGINPEVVDEYYEIDDVVSSMSQLTGESRRKCHTAFSILTAS